MPSLSFTVSALAKVNLYLGVYATKDERGYHRVDSVMAAVGLGDTVTITPGKGALGHHGSRGGFPHGAKQRLARRPSSSAVRMAESPCSITISKSAFPSVPAWAVPLPTLPQLCVAWCAEWDIDIHDERVAAVARSIGADVPFFLYESPAYLSGAAT